MLRILCLLLIGWAVALPVYGQKARHKKAHMAKKPVLGQGLLGTVLFLEGNFMPGPDAKGGSSKGVKRIVQLYAPPLDMDDMEEGGMDGPFIQVGDRKPAYQTVSAKDGSFKLPAAPGANTA